MAAIILLQQQMMRNNTRNGMGGNMGKHSKPRKARWFHKRWEVVNLKTGEVENRYYRLRNANIFTGEMNAWSKDCFDGAVFTVRKREFK